MRPPRPLLATLASLTIVTALQPAPAHAQSTSDYQKAVDEMERTKAELDAASSTFDAQADARLDVQNRLFVTLVDYERRNAELEAVSLTVAGLRSDVGGAEEAVRRLRAGAQQQAVEAYMRNVGVNAASLGLSDSFEAAAVLGTVAERSRESQVDEIERLNGQRLRLRELRAELEREQARLLELRDGLDAAADVLAGLFAEADAEVLRAYQTLEAADAAYQAAVTELEEERRRLARLSGVGHWRALVERYFPAHRVEEALAVMRCESGGNPDARHPGSGATGLFQFLKGTWAFASVRAGFGGASRYDPEANIASAAWLVDYSVRTRHPRGAWGHWVCQP